MWGSSERTYTSEDGCDTCGQNNETMRIVDGHIYCVACSGPYWGGEAEPKEGEGHVAG